MAQTGRRENEIWMFLASSNSSEKVVLSLQVSMRGEMAKMTALELKSVATAF